jgi:TolB-like protein
MDSLAVLPFADLSPERDQAYFCDGLAEELISALTRISGLRVASRTSSFQFRGTAADVREIGRRLGVRVVLEGSVRKAGDRLRITVQVTEAAQGFSLSSECYDRSFEDVLEVQEDIARRVVEALAIKLSENERRTLEQPPTGDARAYDFYLRGRGLLHQYRVSSMLEAREMFRSAVAADSSFALAHAGLSDVCSWLYPWRGRDPECLVEALAASERALELRPDLAEAHVSRGQALAISGELDSADRAFRTAIRLNPRLFEAHHAYGRSCLERGR